MTAELQELYDFLISKGYKKEDIDIKEPDFYEKIDYVFTDEKIIHFINGVYHVSDWYDDHPCFEFKTKEEILYFLKGWNERYKIGFDNIKDAAFSIGILSTMNQLYNSSENNEEYKKFISSYQKVYQTGSNEDKK